MYSQGRSRNAPGGSALGGTLGHHGAVRRQGLHALTWAAWALAALVCVQLAPSPLYVVVVVAISFLVVEVHGGRSPLARAFPVLVALSLGFVAVKIVINALTVHAGAAALFTLPSFTVPSWLGGYPVGGSVETAVVLRAAVEGFVVVGVVAAFAAFNAVVSHYELVQMAPRAFHEPGLVVVVALAFVPSVVGAALAVREADRARTGGVVVRRGRLVRLAVPVLERGMEKALALAESMDARGFGRAAAAGSERVAAWCGVAALGALAAAFLALVGQARAVGFALGGLAAVLLVVAIAAASRASVRTRYRPRRPRAADWAVIAACVAAPAILAAIRATSPGLLVWDPAPPLRLPGFAPLAGLAFALLLAPVAVPAPDTDPWAVPAVPSGRAIEAEHEAAGEAAR